MAVWQFALDLIPATATRVGGADAIRLTRDQLDSIRLELSGEDGARLFERLGSLLPERQSWADELRIWGDERTDDVQVWFGGGSVEAVQFRLNVGDVPPGLINGICSIARDLHCVFVSREGAIIQPTSEAVGRRLLQSPAARFVRDPQAFIEAMAREDCGED